MEDDIPYGASKEFHSRTEVLGTVWAIRGKALPLDSILILAVRMGILSSFDKLCYMYIAF